MTVDGTYTSCAYRELFIHTRYVIVAGLDLHSCEPCVTIYTARRVPPTSGKFWQLFWCTCSACLSRSRHGVYCTPTICFASAARASLHATASRRRCTRRHCDQYDFVCLCHAVLADTVLSLVPATHRHGLAKLLYNLLLFCLGTSRPPMLLCNGLPYPRFHYLTSRANAAATTEVRVLLDSSPYMRV